MFKQLKFFSVVLSASRDCTDLDLLTPAVVFPFSFKSSTATLRHFCTKEVELS